jgi:hypothetical protein
MWARYQQPVAGVGIGVNGATSNAGRDLRSVEARSGSRSPTQTSTGIQAGSERWRASTGNVRSDWPALTRGRRRNPPAHAHARPAVQSRGGGLGAPTLLVAADAYRPAGRRSDGGARSQQAMRRAETSDGTRLELKVRSPSPRRRGRGSRRATVAEHLRPGASSGTRPCQVWDVEKPRGDQPRGHQGEECRRHRQTRRLVGRRARLIPALPPDDARERRPCTFVQVLLFALAESSAARNRQAPAGGGRPAAAAGRPSPSRLRRYSRVHVWR